MQKVNLYPITWEGYNAWLRSILGTSIFKFVYENTPIQIYWKFYNHKRKISRQKFLIFFLYSCSKHRLWVLVRTASWGGSNGYPQFMLFCFFRKIMYTPVKASFTIQKWGLRGVKIIQACFRDSRGIALGRAIKNTNQLPAKVHVPLYKVCRLSLTLLYYAVIIWQYKTFGSCEKW